MNIVFEDINHAMSLRSYLFSMMMNHSDVKNVIVGYAMLPEGRMVEHVGLVFVEDAPTDIVAAEFMTDIRNDIAVGICTNTEEELLSIVTEIMPIETLVNVVDNYLVEI